MKFKVVYQLTISFILSVLLFGACSTPSATVQPEYEEPQSVEIFLDGAFQEVLLEDFSEPTEGMMEFLRNMYTGIKYPYEARSNGIQGIVVIKVTVNELGVLEEAVVSESLGYGCDEEALKAVIKAGKMGFTPAIYKGVPVKSRFDIPVKFKFA